MPVVAAAALGHQHPPRPYSLWTQTLCFKTILTGVLSCRFLIYSTARQLCRGIYQCGAPPPCAPQPKLVGSSSSRVCIHLVVDWEVFSRELWQLGPPTLCVYCVACMEMVSYECGGLGFLV